MLLDLGPPRDEAERDVQTDPYLVKFSIKNVGCKIREHDQMDQGKERLGTIQVQGTCLSMTEKYGNQV